jgi:RNA polymerase sigma-70 factor (ECF subfamily)
MARLRAGAPHALSELLARHRARVIRFGRRSLGDVGRAEDLAQETFLRVLRHAHRYEPRGRFTSWLLTIAARLARNVRRDAGRRAEEPLSAAAERSSGRTPEAAVVRRSVAEALGRLPERRRRALLMKAVEGRSYAEIAEALGTTEANVANLVFRARRGLSRELGWGL